MNRNSRVFEILGNRYFLPIKGNIIETKTKILVESTLLFAQYGYAAVSVRDIADAVEITPGALYNHFDSKESLWVGILDQAEQLFTKYCDELDANIEQADTFEDVIKLIFKKPREMKNIYACYVFSIVCSEKLHDRHAMRIFTDVFWKRGAVLMQGWFDKAIAGGKVKKFDTGIASTAIMDMLLSAVVAWVQNDINPANHSNYLSHVDAAECFIRTVSGTE